MQLLTHVTRLLINACIDNTEGKFKTLPAF